MTLFRRSMRPLGWVAAIATGLLVLVGGGWWARGAAIAEAAQRAQGVLTLYVNNLSGHLGRFEVLPRLVARQDEVLRLLAKPNHPDAVQKANLALSAFANLTGVLDAYVMNPEGLTLAASNWDEPAPFVGQNFAFRPYFQDAMAGREGRYFALGTTSLQRGYYFSSPVRRDGEVIGVAVVKADLSALERSWVDAQQRIMVTDPDGVIFIASDPAWMFHAMAPLAPQALEGMERTRRYPGVHPTPLAVHESQTLWPGAELVSIVPPGAEPVQGFDRLPVLYLLQSAPMVGAGWTVHILSEMGPVTARVFGQVLLVAFAAALVAVSVLAVVQRLRWYRVQVASEQRTARMLAGKEETIRRARDELEIRVRERTAALRLAQDELVQAGKLAAIGQLAAGITHEMNQPLTALRSYADNAQILLQRGRFPDVARNLSLIAELTERMAGISSHLKRFAGKARGEVGPVPLAEVVAASLELLDVGRRLLDVEVRDGVAGHPLLVVAERGRLEQVLVNLLRNAVEAMHDSPVKRLDLMPREVEEADGAWVDLAVADTGHGLSDAQRERLFQPFFTTKQPEAGLGLGLAISHGIVADFGGVLSAGNRPGGGAVFTVRLRRASAIARPQSGEDGNAGLKVTV